MASLTIVKQGTIICQECDKEIDAVEVEGVKTWYGICEECNNKSHKS